MDEEFNNGDSSSSEIEDTQSGEKMIPESRFKEVYGQMKNLEREITTLKSKESGSGLTEEQQKELQAKEYLKSLLKETLSEEKKIEEDKKTEELKKFNDEVENILSIHTDVKKDDFLSFLEKEGDDYSSIQAAMKAYKRLSNVEKEAIGKAKQELQKKPKLPAHEGGGGRQDYSESDKGKSLWQIAQEAATELSKK